MKHIQKFWFVVLTLLFLTLNVRADVVKDLGDDFRYSFTYDTSTGAHIAGETIVLSIQDTAGLWFDFDDETFKSSGWTTKTVNLAEDTTNHNYYYLWEDQGGQLTADTYIFHVELTSGFIREETVTFLATTEATLSPATQAQITAIENYTDGDQESGVYSGVEKMIIAGGR